MSVKKLIIPKTTVKLFKLERDYERYSLKKISSPFYLMDNLKYRKKELKKISARKRLP